MITTATTSATMTITAIAWDAFMELPFLEAVIPDRFGPLVRLNTVSKQLIILPTTVKITARNISNSVRCVDMAQFSPCLDLNLREGC